MIENLEMAREELKRVDHMVYVSLKYTRTVDVLQNIISRMIDAYDYLIEALLILAKEQEKIEEMPQSPIEKANKIKELYEDELIRDNTDLYLLLRRIHRSNPQRENEYRRNVAMKVIIEGREEIINIDIITDYYHYMMQFLERVQELIKEQIKEEKQEQKEQEEDE